MNENQNNKKCPFFTTLVYSAIVLTFLTVVLSAYIRLGVNGLGCESWPDCFGFVGNPETYQVSDTLTDAMPGQPHGPARAAHRLIASVLGMLIVLIVLYTFRKRDSKRSDKIIPLVLLGITVFLSVLGYATPSPWFPIVTLSNLLGGMIMLALLWWLALQATPRSTPVKTRFPGNQRRWSYAVIIILGLQISSGAWVSANFAGPACPDLETCGQDWCATSLLVNSLDLTRQLQVGTNGKIIPEEAMKSIHMGHRLFAIFTFLLLAWYGLKCMASDYRYRAAAGSLLFLLLLEVFAGLGSVASGLSLGIVTLHNALAALLVVNLVHLNYLTRAENAT